MYTPHTVTVYNVHENVDTLIPETNITVLKGVFLDISKGTNVLKSGLASADSATLFIPFSVKAVNGLTGQEQTFVGPKEYERLGDVSGYWTLRSSGSASAVDCFFVKGEVVERSDFGDINDRYDDAYRISNVDTKDFGSPEMQHWEVGGR